MRIRILPYRQGSKSAKALATELGGKVLKLQGSKFKAAVNDVVINWGSTEPLADVTTQPIPSHGLFNSPLYIRQASNKKLFFESLKDKDLTPKYYLSKGDIPNDDYPIVCRTSLSGHSGDGIFIATSSESLVDAPLYVKYEKKKDEYRVHLGKKQSLLSQNYGDTGPQPVVTVIAVQRKARRVADESPNWLVRTHANGFNFVREGVDPPPSVLSSAISAFEETGLDFGAVDVIYNQYKDKSYVLEINTAPGLEGQTVKDYADFFKSFI